MNMRQLLFLCFLGLGCVCALELEGVDAIPQDKCGVTVFVNDATELELYALGEDRSLLHKRQLCTGGWTKWTSMGGVFTSGPKVIVITLIHANFPSLTLDARLCAFFNVKGFDEL
jgi:hypothetical protein